MRLLLASILLFISRILNDIMKCLIIFLGITFLLYTKGWSQNNSFWSQQNWEYEFKSKERDLYRNILKNNNVRAVKTFTEYYNNGKLIPNEELKLDKNGNVIALIRKTNAYRKIKTDVVIEQNVYDTIGNLISSLELNEKKSDTSQFTVYHYDTLNTLVKETIKKEDYIKGANGTWEKSFIHRTYFYENIYDGDHQLIIQIKRNDSRIVSKTAFVYDIDQNLIEIKEYQNGSDCLYRWIKFAYDQNNYLASKLYPSFTCQQRSTVSDNLYTYAYDSKKQLTAVIHSNSGSEREKEIYTYNPQGLLIYIETEQYSEAGNTHIVYEYDD